MAVANAQVGAPSGVPTSSLPPPNPIATALKFIGLMAFNAFTLILVYAFFQDGNYGLAAVFAVIMLGMNIIAFVPALYPLRWMAPGLALVTLLVIYPIIFTVSTAFTNYRDGNLFPKTQAIQQIIRVGGTLAAADTVEYSYQIYQNTDGDYALWLTRPLDDGSGAETLFVRQGSIEPVADAPAEPPADYQGFAPATASRAALDVRRITDWGTGTDVVSVGRSTAERAASSRENRYIYDEATDSITDRQTDAVYTADETAGVFRSRSGATLQPGYRVGVGLANFQRMVSEPGLAGPLVQIFTWTVVFAFLSVVFCFVMGLVMALVLNDPRMPLRPLIRSLLIIPYAIPGVISIVVWRGMLNLNLGVVTNVWETLFNVRPGFLIDPWLAKASILLVNTWLGYPYMMLVCSGALQAIPSEVYEAAAVDGARPWQRFWQITLPLLLVSVGPLLIASFTFNFNNYLLIEALTGADAPRIPNSPVPARYTDILISYTYNIAFGNRGSDYGYASALTIVIFLVVASVTLMQYRFTKTWETVGENV